jgi:S-(hydroxymethyl)glutathione dehydrogenase/alcohol dehydrogenase
VKQAAAAIGSAAALRSPNLAAQAPGAATARTPSQRGQIFRGFVRFGTGASVQEMKLLPIAPRQVVVRTEASQICYTTTAQALGTNPVTQAVIPAHGGVGIVVEVGSSVDRVKVGDRVIVAGQAQCGTCYNCLRGRADHCLMGNAGGEPNRPIAQLSDGTSVAGFRGGLAELIVTFDDYCVPVVTSISPVELAMLPDVGMVGLAGTMTKVRVEAGSDAVIFGCGPVGLSAVQGARIQGAAQIIAVDPIKARRDVALQVGATLALDPNVERDKLVAKIRELCKNRIHARGGGGNTLPDFVFEAVGGDLFPPKAEVGPDPTGITPLQQAWQLCSPVGHVVTTGVGHPRGATISFPASQWANSSKSHHPGNVAGASSLRDIPRFVRLIESGQFNAKALATSTFPLDRAREAFEAAAYRTTIAAVVVYA